MTDHPLEFHKVLSIKDEDSRTPVEVIRDFTRSWVDGMASLVDQIDELMKRAEATVAEERHQDLVAQERWGDEGGYCP